LGKLLPLAACAFLLLLALLYVRREGGEARAVAGATGADSGGEAEALTAVEAPGATPSTARPGERLALDAADSVAREPAARAAPAGVVHGRVVEARTGAPVPDGFDLGVVVRNQDAAKSLFGALFHRSGTRLGPGGAFEVRSSQPERLLADVVCWTGGAELERREPHAYAAERQADGTWRLALEVGWLARVELVTDEDVALESAGLIELVDGVEREWGGAELLRSSPPLVLYRKAAFEAEPAHRRWLQVATDSPGGFARHLARVEIPVANGIQAEPIRVPLPPPTTAHGRVVDERGEPWAFARVSLLPLGGDAFQFQRGEENTDPEGEFEFPELTAGEHWLAVSAQPFAAELRRSLEIVPGPNELGDLVVPRAAATSFVGGSLLSTGERAPEAVVVLRDPRTGLELADDTSSRDGEARFLFACVPAGRYELDVIPLDEHRYRGLPRAIEVPCASLGIEAEPGDGARLALEVRDADSGERLARSEGWALRHGRWVSLWSERDAPWARSDEPLVVLAEDHRPQRLERPPSSAVVALARGWGELVFAVDASPGTSSRAHGFGTPLPGVRVLAEGREVATTDAAGLGLVALAHAPFAPRASNLTPPYLGLDLAFEREGYRLLARSHDGVVLFTREP